jgi:hypothetical protein
VRHTSETTSRLIHGRQRHPCVCVRGVALERVEHLVAIKAADHINLACYCNKNLKAELAWFDKRRWLLAAGPFYGLAARPIMVVTRAGFCGIYNVYLIVRN